MTNTIKLIKAALKTALNDLEKLEQKLIKADKIKPETCTYIIATRSSPMASLDGRHYKNAGAAHSTAGSKRFFNYRDLVVTKIAPPETPVETSSLGPAENSAPVENPAPPLLPRPILGD